MGSLFKSSVVVAALAGLFRYNLRIPELEDRPDVSVNPQANGWEQHLRNSISQHGYGKIEGVLNASEVQGLRDAIQDFCYGEQRKALPLPWGGYSIPDFLSLPEFASSRWLLTDARVHTILKAIFQTKPFRFASHNDVGCDFIGVWHKDVLRGLQKRFQVHDMWSKVGDEQHEIYKVLIYLQDHERDSRSLKVIPGSHVVSDISLDKPQVTLHPKVGDVLVIDQRISHAGNQDYDIFGKGRMFINLGFGKSNLFTDEFEKGTVERQNVGKEKMLKNRQQRGWQTVLTDIKMFTVGTVLTALPPKLLNFFADIDVKKYKWLASLIFAASSPSQDANDPSKHKA